MKVEERLHPNEAGSDDPARIDKLVMLAEEFKEEKMLAVLYLLFKHGGTVKIDTPFIEYESEITGSVDTP